MLDWLNSEIPNYKSPIITQGDRIAAVGVNTLGLVGILGCFVLYKDSRHVRVLEWCSKHGVSNPFDMGPKNWERCLFDLGDVTGVNHDLEYDANDTLVYQ